MINQKEWYFTQINKGLSVFAVIDVTENKSTLSEYIDLAKNEPITMLDNNQASNPHDVAWLAPLDDIELFSWWTTDSKSGIAVSAKNLNDAQAQLKQLFFASLEGESVYFPFFVPAYFAPMVCRFTQPEINIFLGCCSSLLINHQQWLSFDNTARLNEPTQINWRIKPQHLNPDVIDLSFLEAWIYENHPRQITMRINRNSDPRKEIASLFDNHNSPSIQEKIFFTVTEFLNPGLWGSPHYQSAIEHIKDEQAILIELKKLNNILKAYN